MKKVVLINPVQFPGQAISIPFNLIPLITWLRRHGVDAALVDEFVSKDLIAEIATHSPDMVGITATTPLADHAYGLADAIRSRGG